VRRLFADSHYFFALLNPGDSAHKAALANGNQKGVLIVTTDWILLEVADGLCRAEDRHLFEELLENLILDPETMIAEATHEGFEAGVMLYRARQDKDWSLTDCISFEVMRHHGLKEALTGDHHFEQAGFTALLMPGRT